MFSRETIRNLPNNSRFYILVLSVLLSVGTAALQRLQVVSDQLFYIRAEQVFGFIAVCFLYGALIISPLQKLFGSQQLMKDIVFARRAIGVSAAYFASLHAGVALWGQIGGLSGLALLPSRFIWSLSFGALALSILWALAATSFDRVVQWMTFRRWKWLHRLVYGGGIVVLLHVWMIGTHLAYDATQLAAFIALALFFGLESWRVISTLARRYPEYAQKDYFVTLFICLWLFWTLLLLSMPHFIQNYYHQHHVEQGAPTSAQSEHHHE